MLIAILGAGHSRRFGNNKIEAMCGQKPLGQWVLDTALETGFQVVWIGGERPPPFVETRCDFKTNPDRADGLGSSLAVAAREAIARSASRLMVLLADMPHVTLGLLQELEACRAPAACRQTTGHPGPPAVFPNAMFAELEGLAGDRGAGAILRRLPDLITLSPAPDLLDDVDSPEQLVEASQRMEAKFRGGRLPR